MRRRAAVQQWEDGAVGPLDAAGVRDPAVRASYALCRRLHARHGRTYYLATLLLPPAKRPYVSALYGFARWADEVVDDLGSTAGVAEKRAVLDGLEARIRAGEPDDATLPALLDTMRRWRIPAEHFTLFLDSMRMDLEVGEYQTYPDLLRYMDGSAAVIGLQMVPILEPLSPRADDRARALGEAFQLTNFIRDVAEDFQRGRIYLPLEDLARFRVTREDLALGYPSERVRELIRFEVARCRDIYAYAAPGIRLLHPTSRDCMRTAFVLYAGILDEVENAGYDVLTRRVSVPITTRLAVALPGMARASLARREAGAWHALADLAGSGVAPAPHVIARRCT
jgi:15-cis-phytoene synthase